MNINASADTRAQVLELVQQQIAAGFPDEGLAAKLFECVQTCVMGLNEPSKGFCIEVEADLTVFIHAFTRIS